MTDARTEARWDHDRDLRKHEPRPADRVAQVAYLTAYLDTMLAMGAVTEPHAAGLRKAIDRTRETFDMAPLHLEPLAGTPQQRADEMLAEHQASRR